jgi:hypothetical protein
MKLQDFNDSLVLTKLSQTIISLIWKFFKIITYSIILNNHKFAYSNFLSKI